MIATFLACSFAGITYIPVDNSVPLERKENIIRQAGVSIVIDKSIEKIMNISEYNSHLHFPCLIHSLTIRLFFYNILKHL